MKRLALILAATAFIAAPAFAQSEGGMTTNSPASTDSGLSGKGAGTSNLKGRSMTNPASAGSTSMSKPMSKSSTMKKKSGSKMMKKKSKKSGSHS